MNKSQQAILDAFTGAMEELDRLLETVPEEGLDWAKSEDEWSIRQIIHHLTDDGNVYTFIIERGLATPGCKVFFGGFPGNEQWAERLDFSQRSVQAALNLMRAQRVFLSELLGRFPDRWDNKVGYYNESAEKMAERSVADMIVMLTDHMQEHLQMIDNILSHQEP